MPLELDVTPALTDAHTEFVFTTLVKECAAQSEIPEQHRLDYFRKIPKSWTWDGQAIDPTAAPLSDGYRTLSTLLGLPKETVEEKFKKKATGLKDLSDKRRALGFVVHAVGKSARGDLPPDAENYGISRVAGAGGVYTSPTPKHATRRAKRAAKRLEETTPEKKQKTEEKKSAKKSAKKAKKSAKKKIPFAVAGADFSEEGVERFPASPKIEAGMDEEATDKVQAAFDAQAAELQKARAEAKKAQAEAAERRVELAIAKGIAKGLAAAKGPTKKSTPAASTNTSAEDGDDDDSVVRGDARRAGHDAASKAMQTGGAMNADHTFNIDRMETIACNREFATPFPDSSTEYKKISKGNLNINFGSSALSCGVNTTELVLAEGSVSLQDTLSLRAAKAKVSIDVWRQMFGRLMATVGILKGADQQPRLMQKHIQYVTTLERQYRKSCPDGWRTYDQEYRARVSRPVAATGLVSWPDWEQSADIFRQVFFGKQRSTCSQCNGCDHNLDQCPELRGTEEEQAQDGGKIPFVKRPTFVKGKGPQPCREYNQGKKVCSWIKKNGTCQRDHLCSICGKKHPATECPNAFDSG